RAGSPCSQEFGKRPGENQLPAAFTTTGAKIDDVIRRTNNSFFVLDHEQRVAFVAQIVHDADEPADIAGVQADTWLVHDKQRIDQSCAQAGGEVHTLNFATAECAGGAIKREITKADLAEVIEARAD